MVDCLVAERLHFHIPCSAFADLLESLGSHDCPQYPPSSEAYDIVLGPAQQTDLFSRWDLEVDRRIDTDETLPNATFVLGQAVGIQTHDVGGRQYGAVVLEKVDGKKVVTEDIDLVGQVVVRPISGAGVHSAKSLSLGACASDQAVHYPS